MKHFNFVKISGRWFVDVPYNGSVSDLEMVDGADTFLEAYSEGDSNVVHVMIMESEEDHNSGLYLYAIHGETVKLKKKSHSDKELHLHSDDSDVFSDFQQSHTSLFLFP